MSLSLLRKAGLYTAIAAAGLSPVIAYPENLSLDKALYEAIEHNLSLRIEAYQAYMREQDVNAAHAKFDTTLFGSANVNNQEQGWSQSTSESTTASVGVNKSFSSGTSVTLRSNYIENEGSYFDTTLNQQVGGNLSYNSGITLSIRQNLLQGFGTSANMASIWKAEASVAVAQLEYKNSLLDMVNRTEQAYWNVAFQNASLELSQSSVELAEDLLNETQERAELGLATKLDVLQAKANLAGQRESFIDSQRAVKDAEDSLLVAMGRLTPDYQDQSLEVAPMQHFSDVVPTLNEIWSGALENSIDLLVQQTHIESLGFDKILAKDRNKSQLDLVVSGSSKGYSPSDRTDAFDGAFERDGHDWGVGLELNIPIGKRASKAYIHQIDAAVERERLRMEQIEQALFQDVRRAWRTFDVSLEKLDATRITLELREEAFAQEKAKYNEGLAVFRDVQEAQEALDRARISELNAWFSALRAQCDLSRLDGSILERHRIDLNFN